MSPLLLSNKMVFKQPCPQVEGSRKDHEEHATDARASKAATAILIVPQNGRQRLSVQA
jgi:hypothetical protein